MPLATSQVLQDRYRIVKLIGQGGFGAVYRAWDLSLNKACAVKENLDASEEARRQFQREASVMAGLAHTNLPRVTDHFYLPGKGQYLVMDFVEGQSLDQIMATQNGPLDEAEALLWIEQICDALEYLHSRTPPIIHRDIKPENIIITPEGRAMLVDFGISKIYDPALRTTIGAKAVTPGYSPPEQYGGGVTDARTDIYALGATLYKLLTNQDPPESVQRMVGASTLIEPRKLNNRLGSGVERVILQATQVNTTERFQNVSELRAALGKQADDEPERKRPLPIWLWFILGLIILCLAGWGGIRVLNENKATFVSAPTASITADSSPMATTTATLTQTPTGIPFLVGTPTLTSVRPTRTATSTRLRLIIMTPTPTRTRRLTATPTRIRVLASSTPRLTVTPERSTATPTINSLPTNTPLLPATNTSLPPATNTPLPPATNTPLPPATNTPRPPSTNTPDPYPLSTDTPTSPPTNTPQPYPYP